MSDALIRDLADRQAIRDLIFTYCRAVDRIDVPLGRSIWHDDGYADYGKDFYQGPGKDVIDLICKSHDGLVSHWHQVGNVLIALDGDRAGSESYIDGTMRRMHDGKLMQMGVWGRYCDRWERRDGRWGLIHRVVVMDHTEMREAAPMPTHGACPTHDRTDPSYAALEWFK
ncbi:MAG: nuclear transport factor 2 family protein [Sphingomonadales bacterium]|nr:nuclear transport factor 2 family protein [Sphingomonadales bacterium]